MLHASLSSKNMSLVVCIVRGVHRHLVSCHFSVLSHQSETSKTNYYFLSTHPENSEMYNYIICSFFPWWEWACYISRCLEIRVQEKSVAGVWSLPSCPAHTLTEKSRTLTRDGFIYGWKQDPESQLGRKEIKVRIHICREVKEEGRAKRQTTERGALGWILFPITSGFCMGHTFSRVYRL